MKKVIIKGKEYFQMEASDIEKLPSQNHDKDMLKNNELFARDLINNLLK